MLEIIKDPTFAERNIPLGILEVTYPDRSAWDITKFYDLVHEMCIRDRLMLSRKQTSGNVIKKLYFAAG